MARIDTLEHFFKDVADSIRLKKESEELISPEDFDTEIENIETGTEIDDGSYLFYQNARINNYSDIIKALKPLSNTYYMFCNASNLNQEVILSKELLNNITKNTSFYQMFYGATSIPSISVSCNSNVITTTEGMFYNCNNATSIIANIDTSNVTTMINMFNGCTNITTLDVSSFNGSKVASVGSMFAGCKKLTSIIGLKDFLRTTTKLQNLASMFSTCNELTNVDLSDITFASNPQLNYLFNNCTKLKTVDITGFPNTNQALQYMFNGCDNLKSINGLNDFLSNITTSNNMNYFFASTSTDTTIEGTLDIDTTGWLPNLNKSSGGNTLNFLRYNKCIRNINLAFLEGTNFTGTNIQELFYNASSLKSITIPNINTSSTTSFQHLFRGCIRLESIVGLNYIRTDNATNLRSMFRDCQSLGNIDVSHFDTSKVVGTTYSDGAETGFGHMFYNCKSMTNIDLSNWVANVNVRHIDRMFENCEKLITVKLPDFTAVTGTLSSPCMFKNCKALTSINLGTLTFARMSTLAELFNGCTALTTLTYDTTQSPVGRDCNAMFKDCTSLVNVDARFLGDMRTGRGGYSAVGMFENCTSLESVDLSNMECNDYLIRNFNAMFKNCTSLKTITLKHVAGKAVFGSTSYMTYPAELFANCSSLEVLDLRYCFIAGYMENTNIGTLFQGCTKLRKLDLRGTSMGNLASNNSSWRRDDSYFRDVGSDNDTPTIVYTDSASKQAHIIENANQVGKNWSTANVIVAGLDEVVDMT